MPESGSLQQTIGPALAARAALLDPEHRGAVRLFNGHLEGDPRYVVDAYGRTLVVFHHPQPDAADDQADLVATLRQHYPWAQAILVKDRTGATEDARRGRLAFVAPGSPGPDTVVLEHGVRYAVDLTLNQDASFYLDTRELRRWLIDHSEGRTVLNTFAYTGSLGVAARAGGAARVLHTDLKARFLQVAKASYALNGFAVDRKDFQARDFWSFVRGQKLQGARFDCVVLDPPFFSATAGGTLDLNQDLPRLINKLRPLVRSGGTMVVVNNSLFVSGAEHMRALEALCEGGWLSIEELIPVPQDVTGFPGTRVGQPPVDPAPFVHATKIAVLKVRHRTAEA